MYYFEPGFSHGLHGTLRCFSFWQFGAISLWFNSTLLWFICISLITNEIKHFFQMLINHLDVCFCEVPIRSFYFTLYFLYFPLFCTHAVCQLYTLQRVFYFVYFFCSLSLWYLLMSRRYSFLS